MNKIQNLIPLVLAVFLWTACSKDHSTPDPPSNPQDSSGWTRFNAGLGNIALSEVYFTDSLHGFIAAADKNLYASTDGGLSWKKIDGVQAQKMFLQFFFLDKQHGYVIGRDELAFTVDGGKSWTVKGLSGPISNIWANVYFVSPSTGFFTTGEATYRTTDTGTTWQEVMAEASNGIYFTDRLTGYAFTKGDSISRTTDGGDHWQALSLLPSTSEVSTDIYNVLQFTDSQHGWMMDYITLASTSDAGAHWTSLLSTPISNAVFYTDFQMVNNQTGWLAMPGSISKTSNGGVDWEKSYTSGSEPIISIYFTDEHHGWAGCGNGILLKYHR
jgi:photosystem II stability/assembly factor-like uncharacterized protein